MVHQQHQMEVLDLWQHQMVQMELVHHQVQMELVGMILQVWQNSIHGYGSV